MSRHKRSKWLVELDSFLHYGLRVVIYYDDSPDPPDEGDDYAFLGELRNIRSVLGRSGYDYQPVGDGEEDVESAVEECNARWRSQGYDVVPVRYEDYGSRGARLVTCEPEEAHGGVFVQARTPLEELASLTTAEDVAESVIDQWNQWLEGDVYIIQIVDPETDEALETHGSVYGREDAEAIGREEAEGFAAYRSRQRAEREVSGLTEVEEQLLCGCVG